MIETLLDFSGLEDISRDLQLLSGAENNRVHARGNDARDHEADRHIHANQNAKHSRIGRAALGVFNGVAQNEVRENHEHQNEVRGKTRLPCPPHAPLEALPQLAREHRARYAHKRDLGCDTRARVVALLFSR